MVSETGTIADSASGKLNGYFFRCSVVGQSRPYAGCLGRIGGDNRDADCQSAIAGSDCPAQQMRKEEELKGIPVYFQPRPKFDATINAAGRVWNKGGVSETMLKMFSVSYPEGVPEVAGKIASKKAGVFSKMRDYGDAVAVAVKNNERSYVSDLLAKPAIASSTPRPVQRLQLLPGETPIEALRRIKAQTA